MIKAIALLLMLQLSRTYKLQTKTILAISQQMIQAIKRIVANSIILVFSPTRLSNLMNYG